MAKQRFLALDTMRGLVIAGMILVNTPGSWKYVWAPLRHAKWDGLTATDLVFPFFLWMMGFAMALTLPRMAEQGIQHAKIWRRGIILFALGLFLANFPFHKSLDSWRILGVLQRIGICYVLAAYLCLFLKTRGLWFISALFLLGYWLLLIVFGDLTVEGNLVGAVDRFTIGDSHLWHGLGVPFDPEGLLSSIPATISVVLGYLAGRMFFKQDLRKGMRLLLIQGLILGGIGWIWHLWFPVNKSLWSSSFVLVTSSLAAWFMALLLFVLDEKGWKKGSGFATVFGMNSLFTYALSMLWVRILIYVIQLPEPQVNGYRWLFHSVYEPFFGSHFGSFLFAITHVFIFWFVAWLLNRKKIYIRI